MNGAIRPNGTKSRLHRRVDAARSLASDLADQGHNRMAQVIRDLCNSASASATTNAQLHRDLADANARATYPAGAVPLPREVFDFLMGVGPLDGAHFGDLNSSLPGRFWWRSFLRIAERQAAQKAPANTPQSPSSPTGEKE